MARNRNQQAIDVSDLDLSDIEKSYNQMDSQLEIPTLQASNSSLHFVQAEDASADLGSSLWLSLSAYQSQQSTAAFQNAKSKQYWSHDSKPP